MINVADLSDKYSRMTRAHDRGAKDGAANVPANGTTNLTETEVEIVNLAQADAEKTAEEQRTRNDEAWEEIRDDLSNLPKTFPLDGTSFKVEAQQETLKTEADLMRLYKTLLTRRQDYRYFKTYHRLNREADVPSSLFSSLAFIFFILVADGVLNAYFFRDVSRDALVGGFIMAFGISLVNTSVGFLTGLLPWRYLQHRTRLHLLWAFPLLVALLATLIAFNLGVGHYRDLLLTVSPEVAADRLAKSVVTAPWGIREPTSWLAVIVGFGIAMLALYKGYTIFDPYPRYGRAYRRRQDAEDAYNEKIQEVQLGVNQISKRFLSKAGKTYQDLTKTLKNVAKTVDDFATSNEAYSVRLGAIENAANAVLSIYRSANAQVRDRERFPEPAHFSRSWELARRAHIYDASALNKIRNDLSHMASAYESGLEALKRGIAEEERDLLSREAFQRRVGQLKDAAEGEFTKENA